MSYVKTINEDGVVSDIMAKAIDPTLDATILKKSNLVNGFTQVDAGVNALDAAAGKTLNDSLANKADAAELTALADDYRQKVFCKQWDITINVSVPANGNTLIFSGQAIRNDLPSGAHIISARCAWASNNNIIISQSWLSDNGNLTARAYNPTNAAITVTSATAVAFYYL